MGFLYREVSFQTRGEIKAKEHDDFPKHNRIISYCSNVGVYSSCIMFCWCWSLSAKTRGFRSLRQFQITVNATLLFFVPKYVLHPYMYRINILQYMFSSNIQNVQRKYMRTFLDCISLLKKKKRCACRKFRFYYYVFRT